MNLTSMLKKDAAIVDLSWTTDGLVHPGEPHLDLSTVKKHNNIKPELELQWGGGGPNIDLDEPAGMVSRNLPDDGVEAGKVILFARDLMNKGRPASEVIRGLKVRFGKSVLKAAKAGLQEQLKLDGVVGRIAVDSRGYDSCKDALKAASASPYKRFIRYVVGCNCGCGCGDPQMLPVGGPGGMELVESTGNPVDDFLASKTASQTELKAHCRSTMLPVLAGDVSPSEMDQILVEMTEVVGLPGSVKDAIASKKATNVAKLRAAFRWLDRAAAKVADDKYAGKVKAQSGFGLEGELTDFVPDLAPAGAIEVNEAPAPVAVDDMAPVPEGLDVDMCLFMEPEFEGGDEISLEESVVAPSQLDVDMRQDMAI